jgi:tetratricopeptide (TPR) repeat protein
VAIEDLNAALPSLKVEHKPWVLSERGAAYNEVGRYDEAITDFNQVLSATGVEAVDWNRAKVGRGISLYFTKAYNRAASDFSDMIRDTTPPNAIVVYLRGLSWRALNDETSAQTDIAWAIRLHGDIESKMRGYGVIK